jgi:hypothetical protein
MENKEIKIVAIAGTPNTSHNIHVCENKNKSSLLDDCWFTAISNISAMYKFSKNHFI